MSQRQGFEAVVNLVARGEMPPAYLGRWVVNCASDPARYARSLVRTIRAARGKRALRLWEAWQAACARAPELAVEADVAEIADAIKSCNTKEV